MLHMLRAVQLANGGRPSDALLDLEHVEVYRENFPGLAEARDRIDEMLHQAGKMLSEVQGQLGVRYQGNYRVQAVLNAEGQAPGRAGEASTPARGTNSARLPGRSRPGSGCGPPGCWRAWLRAEAACPRGRTGRPAPGPSTAATVLLASRQLSTVGDVLAGWSAVLSEHPDLAKPLALVGPEHVLALFTRPDSKEESSEPASLVPDVASDVVGQSRPPHQGNALPLEPEPESGAESGVAADAPTAGAPLLAVPGPPPADTAAEDVPPEFWLFSRRGLGLKAAAAAAAALLLAVGVLWMADSRRQARRDDAYAQLREGLARRDEAAVRESLDRLGQTPPLLGTPGTRAQAAAADDTAAALGRLDRLRARDAGGRPGAGRRR